MRDMAGERPAPGTREPRPTGTRRDFLGISAFRKKEPIPPTPPPTGDASLDAVRQEIAAIPTAEEIVGSGKMSRRQLVGRGVAAGVAVAVVGAEVALPSTASAHPIHPEQPQPSFLDQATGAFKGLLSRLGIMTSAEAHGPTGKMMSESEVKRMAQRAAASVSPERKAQIMVAKQVDGLDTYGLAADGSTNQALDSNELIVLIQDKFNAEFSDAMLREGEYYVTVCFSQTQYNGFKADAANNGETPEAFIQRQYQEASNMMIAANPALKGVKVRRMILLKDGVDAPGSNHLGYLTNGIKDSSGIFSVHQNPYLKFVNGIYTPTKSQHWEATKRVDYDWIHEGFHEVAHLYDEYAFDAQAAALLSGWSTAWQSYIVSKRVDINRNDVMVATRPMNEVGLYTAWQLARREGNLHNLAQYIPEITGAPPEFPGLAQVTFENDAGQVLTPESVQIFRTKGTGNYYDKTFDTTPIYTGSLDNIKPYDLLTKNRDGSSNLDENKKVKLTDSTLLVKFTAGGQEYMRYWDVRDFNLAAWKGGKIGGIAKMRMKAASKNSNSNTFDWTINYSYYPTVYLPDTERNKVSIP